MASEPNLRGTPAAALPRTRVLVVEDDERIAGLLDRGLSREGALVSLARTGRAGLDRARERRFDVVVLDVMLPDLDGFAVCRELRERDEELPVIMLTARGQVEDRIDGLEAGADDYLPKPFVFDELLARLRALVRRGGRGGDVLEVGDLRLDPGSHMVRRGETLIELTLREFEVLEVFMRHAGHVLSRQALIDHAWPRDAGVTSNVVDVYVRYLRERIDRPFGRSSLQTVRGLGYRLVDDARP